MAKKQPPPQKPSYPPKGGKTQERGK